MILITEFMNEKAVDLLRSKYDVIYDKSLADNQEKIPCLLYTSPSPRDRTRSRMPSSA